MVATRRTSASQARWFAGSGGSAETQAVSGHSERTPEPAERSDGVRAAERYRKRLLGGAQCPNIVASVLEFNADIWENRPRDMARVYSCNNITEAAVYYIHDHR